MNGLADQFVQDVPPKFSPTFDNNFTGRGQSTEDGLQTMMKRGITTDSDAVPKDRSDIPEPLSDARMYTRRRSIATPMMSNEESPLRSHEYHHPSQSSIVAQAEGDLL
jgi:hypothetical protein